MRQKDVKAKEETKNQKKSEEVTFFLLDVF